MDYEFKFEFDYKDINKCQRCGNVCISDLCDKCEKWLNDYMLKFGSKTGV